MNRFKAAYAEALKQAVAEHPEEYMWLTNTTIVGNAGNTIWKMDTVENVTVKMFQAMDSGSYNKDGRAFRIACKKLGIPHSYKAINQILAEGDNDSV